MPTVEQVNWAKLRIAVMTGSAIAILSVLIYLLTGGFVFFQPTVDVYTYMGDLRGLTLRAPVRLNGILIGKVRSVQLTPSKDLQRIIQVQMAVNESFLAAIPEDSTVAVGADNVLGTDKYVDITQGKSPRSVPAGGSLYSPPPREINKAEMIKSAQAMVTRLDSVLADMEAGKGPFGKIVKGEEVYNQALGKVVGFQKEMAAATRKDAAFGRLLYDDTLYAEIRAPLKRLDDRLAELQAGRGPGGDFLRDTTQFDQWRKSIAELARTLDDLQAGRGATGRLVQDDELYRKIRRQVDQLNADVDALIAGEGQLGPLLVSTQWYESMQGSLQDLQSTLNEFRTNPKKFLRVKLF